MFYPTKTKTKNTACFYPATKHSRIYPARKQSPTQTALIKKAKTRTQLD